MAGTVNDQLKRLCERTGVLRTDLVKGINTVLTSNGLSGEAIDLMTLENGVISRNALLAAIAILGRSSKIDFNQGAMLGLAFADQQLGLQPEKPERKRKKDSSLGLIPGDDAYLKTIVDLALARLELGKHLHAEQDALKTQTQNAAWRWDTVLERKSHRRFANYLMSTDPLLVSKKELLEEKLMDRLRDKPGTYLAAFTDILTHHGRATGKMSECFFSYMRALEENLEQERVLTEQGLPEGLSLKSYSIKAKKILEAASPSHHAR